MIKKLLLSFAVVAVAALAVNAQPCTPSPQYLNAAPGVYPDSFPPACKNDPNGYNFTIDVKTLNDTTVVFSGFNIELWVKAIKIIDITGLPAGFVWAAAYNGDINGDPAWVNQGSVEPLTEVQGCVQVSASANAIAALPTGNNAISVSVDLWVKNKNPNQGILTNYAWSSTLTPVTYEFNLEIQDNCILGLEELDASKFSVAPNFPNPFSTSTTIPFTTVKEEKMTFKMYNALGMLVHENEFVSQAGKNMYLMDASKFSSGMYIFTLSNGKETITRKMTIQK